MIRLNKSASSPWRTVLSLNFILLFQSPFVISQLTEKILLFIFHAVQNILIDLNEEDKRTSSDVLRGFRIWLLHLDRPWQRVFWLDVKEELMQFDLICRSHFLFSPVFCSSFACSMFLSKRMICRAKCRLISSWFSNRVFHSLPKWQNDRRLFAHQRGEEWARFSSTEHETRCSDRKNFFRSHSRDTFDLSSYIGMSAH